MGKPRPSVVEIQRQRFKCMRLLAEFCELYKVGIKDITGPGQFHSTMRKRKRFIRFAYDSGCGLTAISKVVKRDVSTVDYHIRGVRKLRRERIRRYDAVRRASDGAAHV